MDQASFYLGVSQAQWLHVEDGAPLFLAAHRLQQWLCNENWPRVPAVRWAMDSGGFNHVRKHGGWTISPEDFVGVVWSHDLHISNMQWAAPQDWMCEPDILALTGLTVADHQQRTVDNFVQVCRAWAQLEYDNDGTEWLRDPYNVTDETAGAWRRCPFIPVLQGWEADDYLRCADMYAAVGVDLAAYPVVGLGSVCRRQSTKDIEVVVARVTELGLPLHGFGVKTDGLRRVGHLLASADSHAWSMAARREETYCTHGGSVRWERNCRAYALEWRDRVLAQIPPTPTTPTPVWSQLALAAA